MAFKSSRWTSIISRAPLLPSTVGQNLGILVVSSRRLVRMGAIRFSASRSIELDQSQSPNSGETKRAYHVRSVPVWYLDGSKGAINRGGARTRALQVLTAFELQELGLNEFWEVEILLGFFFVLGRHS